MAFAGGWSLPSKRMPIPMPTLANRAALFASFRDGFRERWVANDSVVNCSARDSQGFSGVQVIHALPKQADNQATSNVKFLGHEGKFAENRVVVEVSAFERGDCVQPAPLTNA